MQFDFFLWRILIPMIIPILYTIKFKKEALLNIFIILIVMIFIVIFYMPLTDLIYSPSNIIIKIFLFIIIPIILLFLLDLKKSKPKREWFTNFGIQKEGFKKSMVLACLFLPIMLITTLIIKYLAVSYSGVGFIFGIISFFESFTEEFFFRGILFIYLLKITDIKVAYITSFASFILMHPQNFDKLFIVITIVQGLLTVEIARRTKNITGAWFLHGTNRLFSLVFVPIILLI